MSFTPGTMALIMQDYAASPFGDRGKCLKHWAKLLGCHWSKINKIVNARTRTRAAQPIKPEYHTWAHVVFQIKKRPPEEAGEISTEDALALGIQSGLLPAEAADVPVATFNRIGRAHSWHKTSIRANRFQAEKPNDAHHFDASTSKFLYIAREEANGEYILRLHRPAKHYKNKPIPVDKLRPWIYGLTDDHSGRFIARYVAARGESARDSMDFICWAWDRMGLCKKLFADQGMLKKSLPARDLNERLGVEFPQMMPYQKRGHGKIERPWRTNWLKFELPFFAAITDWEKFEISKTELNQHLENYLEAKYNQLPHRFERNITRMQAWNRINLDGGLVKIPEHTLRTIAEEIPRTVTVEGIVWVEGTAYEVMGLHSAKVVLLRSVFDKGQLVARDIQTGKKYAVRDFKPLKLDEFRGHKETPHQTLVRASAELPLAGQGLYANTPAFGHPSLNKAGSLAHMPIKTKEERVIEDPFCVDQYASLKEAMQEFSEIVCVFMPPAERKEVERLITINGLKKSFVSDLALDIRASIEQRRAVSM
jgi:hypothetical protein